MFSDASKREHLKTDSTSFDNDELDDNDISEDDEVDDGLDVVLSRRPGAEILLEGGVLDEEEEQPCTASDLENNVVVEDKFWTTSMKTLALTALLFSVITILQVFGATLANSKALLVDCISMGVDAGTYLGNMAVEYKRHSKHHAPFELAVGGLSLVTLIYFTLDALRESVDAISPGGGDSEDEDVNAWIIFAFALGGLLFDAVSLYAFRRSHRKTRSGREMNMWTALLHVGADFLRSATTLVSSMMILLLGYDGVAVDAWASLLVGATILLGAGFGLAGWTRKFAQWCCA